MGRRVWVGVGVVLVMVAAPAWGRPFYGSHACFSCHGGTFGENDPRLTIEGADGTANPVERAGAVDRGTRPVFVVRQGQTERLQVQVGDIGQQTSYDVVVTNAFQEPGVSGGGMIEFTADPQWTPRDNGAGGAEWYSRAPANPHTPFRWTGPVSYTFDITPSLTTPPDFYDFAFEWSGRSGVDGGLDTGLQQFYVQVVPVPEPGSIAGVVMAGWLAGRRRRR